MSKAPPAASPDSGKSHEAIATVLNSLDALVYVADMETYELLFFNDYGQTRWGAPAGRRCWEVLQKNQTGPCAFCTNSRLTDSTGKASGVYVWEFQNTQNGHWYQCRDQAVPWIDGRLVRIEVATDITERKQIEQQLELARQKAEHLACTDMLTGLNNRRAFFTLGEQLLKEAARFSQPVSVIMFDLDHFKQINDTYGHAAGDAVLVNLGEVALSTIRQADILARLGGEEFALLLPQTDFAHAKILAERLRSAFADTRTEFNGQQITCTASFGISLLRNPETDTLDKLLSKADRRLYAAKAEGRNRAVTCD